MAEKSIVPIGYFELPSTLPPASLMKFVVSACNDAPKALSVEMKYQVLPPAFTVSAATAFDSI